MELLESHKAVVAAIAANIAIAAMKLGAGVAGGSSSLLAEGVHSLVDTGNGLIMLHGVKASRRPPDAIHPFGHGQDLYFWTLIVAVVIFGLGGGASILEGLYRLKPHKLERFWLGMGVLAATLPFELSSFVIAWRELRGDGPSGGGILASVRASLDPSRFAVLYEDSAGIAGVLAAMVFLALARLTGKSWLDGAGSIVIGLILAAAAVSLIRQARRLLIGQGLSARLRDEAVARLKADPDVADVTAFSTMYLGPSSVLVVAVVDLKPPLVPGRPQAVRRRLKEALREAVPEAAHVFIELEPGDED